jgi:TolB protein
MADEQEQSPAEAGSEELPQAPSAQVEAVAEPSAGHARWSGTLLAVALIAVALTLYGIYQQTRPVPHFLSLGVGLVLWGILDLIAQRRGLIVWRGAKAVVGNTVNLIRGLAVLGMGTWLCLVAFGAMPMTSTVTVTDMAAFFLVAYLGVALVLEALVKDVKVSGQAFLLAALSLQLISFMYFSQPFTYSWAAIFAGLAYGAGAWAIFNGAMGDNPALSRAVLLATLALGSPFITFTVQQMFFIEEQPVYNPTLADRRMRLILGGLGENASQVLWAPMNTHLGQPGDIPFSDKMAFTDHWKHAPSLGFFIQKEDQPKGDMTWVPTGEEAKLTAFSQDGRLLAYTDRKKGAESHLAVLRPSGVERSPWPEADKESDEEEENPGPRTRTGMPAPVDLEASYGVKRPYAGSVEPGPEHGQVWRDLGKQLYFAAPEGAPKTPGSVVKRVDLRAQKVTTIRPDRGMPAISPDGSALLTVGFIASFPYLDMADGINGGRNERLFKWQNEKRYFPAWNAAQTRVIFLKGGKLHTMKSNGTDQRDFSAKAIDSRLWFSDKTVPFTLEWLESGDRWKIYHSDPQGHHERMIYDVRAQAISPPQWSPDGSRVAFIEQKTGQSTVMSLDPDGKWLRRFFISPDKLRELKWSPDSQKLAWIVDRIEDGNIVAQEVWTAVLAGMDPIKVYETRGRLSGLSWAPQGKHLAFEETYDWRFLGIRLVRPDLHTVMMVDLVDNHARAMTRYGLMSRQAVFSPQGVAIAYFTDNSPWSPGPRLKRDSALVLSQLY